MKTRVQVTVAMIAMLTAASVLAQTEDIATRVAEVKQTLVASKAALKNYEWIELTAVSFKGDEKARVENRCYFGADGKLQKVPVAAAEADKKRGLRGKVVENKKEEIGAYVEQAKELLASYLPPDPARLQACKDAGKVSVTPLEPGKRVRLEFRDYLKPGDTLGLELDIVQNRLLKADVASYLAKPEDAVTLDANLGTLEDGTSYPEKVTFVAAAVGIQTVTQNSGYKKAGAN